MFSLPVAGAGSVCLGCQLRVVTRRAPGLAAAATTTSSSSAAAQRRIRRQQRRYASGSPNAQGEDLGTFDAIFAAHVHREEIGEAKPHAKAKAKAKWGRKKKSGFKDMQESPRHDDDWDVPTVDTKDRRRPSSVRSEKAREAARVGMPLTHIPTDRSHLGGSYTQPDVSFEDVWQQISTEDRDSDYGKHEDSTHVAPVEHDPGEINYGDLNLDKEPSVKKFKFSWATDEAELRAKYAASNPRPKSRKHQGSTNVASVTHDPAEISYGDLNPDKKPSVRSTSGAEDEAESPNKYAALDPRPMPKTIETPPLLPAQQPAIDHHTIKTSLTRSGNDVNSETPDWTQSESTGPQTPRVRPPRTIPTDNLFPRSNVSRRFQWQQKPTGHRLQFGQESTTQPQELPNGLAGLGSPEAPKPAPKYHRRGPLRLVEESLKLPIATLGKEAEVIMMREDGKWVGEKELEVDSRPAAPTMKVDGTVHPKEGLGLDGVMEYIDGLRPPSQILPAREFKTTFDTLVEGFTVFHLEAYVVRNQKRAADGDERPFVEILPDEIASYPWIVSQGHWTPEVKGAVGSVNHPLTGYILKSMTAKQRLAMQLMRECWRMSVRELLEGPGILEVTMRDREFRLLTLGQQHLLQRISQTDLAPGGGKAIHVVKSRHMLRILAPKKIAESCLKAIHEEFGKIRTKSVSLTMETSALLNAAVLEELSQLTNSLLELNETRQEVKVIWIDVGGRADAKVADMGDVVLRLILTLRPSTRTGDALAVSPPLPEKVRLIEDIGSRDKLSWADRRLAWARLCAPVATRAHQLPRARISPLSELMLRHLHYKLEPSADDFMRRTSVITPKIESHLAAPFTSCAGVPIGFPRPRQLSQEELMDEIIQPTKPTSSGWLPYRVRTNAVFGHILHLNHKDLADSLNKGTAGLAASRRALKPLIPPLTEMHLPGWVPYNEDTNMTSLIVMRFLPTLDSPSSTTTTPPTLELRLQATDDEILGVDSLRAIAHTHVADICLPGENVDTRLTQRVVAELAGGDIDSRPDLRPLMQFLEDSVLEPAHGHLVTPPVLDGLHLPTWLLYAPESDRLSPFLRSNALAELCDAHKASTAAPSDGSSTPAKPRKPSKKAKKPKGKAAAALAQPAQNPYSPEANASTRVSYVFAGLEVHRPVETAYEGWQLCYMSIEAGASGGHRAELSLSAQPAADRALQCQMQNIAPAAWPFAWLRSVYRLVMGLNPNKERRAADDDGVAPGEEGARGVVKWVIK